MKKNQSTRIIHMPLSRSVRDNPSILRIHLTPEFTKIDFGHAAIPIYDFGGWIRIDKDTFIEIVETGERLKMTEAINIPIAPKQLHYESIRDWCYFSLIFPPIPIKKCKLNIIENEFGDSSDFNYYDVLIDPFKAEFVVNY